MDIDFHFYGTYLAAREAEFNHGEALQIATAAQMVDLCTPCFLNEVFGTDCSKEYKKELIATCIDKFEYKGYIDDEKDMWGIWMPFHFLPGNLDNSFQSEIIDEKMKNNVFFKTLCLPNSQLVYDMILNTKEVCRVNDSEYTRPNILALIGISMHVLADTWAHEYFVGVNSSELNGFTDYTVNGKMNFWNKFLGAPNWSEKLYKQMQLGHAQAGHWPDLGNITYSYKPSWVIPNIRMEKDNPEIFMQAFIQMVQAMKFIKDASEFNVSKELYFLPDESKDSNSNIKFIKSSYEQPSDWTSAPNYKVNLQELYNLIKTTADNETANWIEFVNKTYNEFGEIEFKELQDLSKEIIQRELQERKIVENALGKVAEKDSMSKEDLDELKKKYFDNQKENAKLVKAVSNLMKQEKYQVKDRSVAYIYTFCDAARIQYELVRARLANANIELKELKNI